MTILVSYEKQKRIILNMVNPWKVSPLLEWFNPKAASQSGNFGSDGIQVIYHCITNYPKGLAQQFYFIHPFVGQELRRTAFLVNSCLGFLMHLHYVPTATIWHYVPTGTVNVLLGCMFKVAYSPGWQVLLAVGWQFSWGCLLEHVCATSLCVL